MIVKINTLPKELFVAIISYLHSSDKLNCIRVCRQWHRIITSTILYNDLTFKDVEKFHQAFALFDDNKNMGQQVSQLTIVDCNIDMYSILSLPRLFPNVKHFSWEERQIDRTIDCRVAEDEVNYPPRAVCQQAFKKWSNNLESITDIPVVLHISRGLLGATTYQNLRKIDISFLHYTVSGDHTVRNTPYLLTSLIRGIKNAPSLESITLVAVAIDFNDMEDLHDTAPNLQELTVQEAYFLNKKARPTNVRPAYNFKSLSLDCCVGVFYRLGFDVAKIQEVHSVWLDYVGQKYQNLNKLELLLRNDTFAPVPNFNFPEQHLLDALKNMSKITSYSTEVYHLTDRILNTMHNSNIKLKCIQLWLVNSNQMQEEFKALQRSSQKATIETLNIDRARSFYEIDNVVFGHSLLSLTSKLANLVNLKVMGIYNGQMTLLFDILQNYPMLESLCFHNLKFKIGDGNIAKKKKVMNNRTRIKNLDLSVSFHGQEVDDDNKMLQVNRTFEFIIASCPLLEVFELTGNSLNQQTGGVCEICFLGNNRLRTIKISTWNTPIYYAFNHIPSKRGKCWKNYYEQIEDDYSIKDGFHINLTWCGSVELILR